MPELPEVESVARALRQNLLGRVCTGLRVRFPGRRGTLAGGPAPRHGRPGAAGVHRHGKYLVLTFGRRRRRPGGRRRRPPGRPHPRHAPPAHDRPGGPRRPSPADPHVHLELDFEGLPVRYRDIRKFGRWTVVDDPHRPTCLAHVGPDMLDVRFAGLARRRGRPPRAPQGRPPGPGRRRRHRQHLRRRGALPGPGPPARPPLRPAPADPAGGAAQRPRRPAPGHRPRRHDVPQLRQFPRPARAASGASCGSTAAPASRAGSARAPIERIVVGGRSTHFCPRCQTPR